MLTRRYDQAFQYAHGLHREQSRKGTDIPYISHLMTVSAIVIENGGNEDQAIAALLHDAAEDQGGTATLDEIRRRFGGSVADIVYDCTDAWTEPKPEWRSRKEAYLVKLPAKWCDLCSFRWPTRSTTRRLYCSTIASSVSRSGKDSTAARMARDGTTPPWPMFLSR